MTVAWDRSILSHRGRAMALNKSRRELSRIASDLDFTKLNSGVGESTESVRLVACDAFDAISLLVIASPREPIGKKSPAQASIAREESAELNQLFTIAFTPNISETLCHGTPTRDHTSLDRESQTISSQSQFHISSLFACTILCPFDLSLGKVWRRLLEGHRNRISSLADTF
jgi:hypothetical protein